MVAMGTKDNDKHRLLPPGGMASYYFSSRRRTWKLVGCWLSLMCEQVQLFGQDTGDIEVVQQ